MHHKKLDASQEATHASQKSQMHHRKPQMHHYGLQMCRFISQAQKNHVFLVKNASLNEKYVV